MSHFEPLVLSDVKCPDGASVIPWHNRNVLVWDTCLDMFAPFYMNIIDIKVRVVASWAEDLKKMKYQTISTTHHFRIEASGVIGLEAASFFLDLVRHIVEETGEAKDHHFLLQRISVAT